MDPAERYPVGSPDWAGRISSRAWAEYNRAEICGFRPLVEVLELAVPGKPWLAWPPETPWGSVDIWSRELFGQGWAKLLAIVREIDEPAANKLAMIAAPEEVGPGQGHRSDLEPHAVGTKLPHGSNSSTYLAARLRRDRPDLAAEVEAGRLRLRTAARPASSSRPIPIGSSWRGRTAPATRTARRSRSTSPAWRAPSATWSRPRASRRSPPWATSWASAARTSTRRSGTGGGGSRSPASPTRSSSTTR
jgi:hypothetical protein